MGALARGLLRSGDTEERLHISWRISMKRQLWSPGFLCALVLLLSAGTIVKSGDKYKFQDAASGNTYDIDHQDQVKQFEGKKVRVHGTLDESAKVIHVQ
jgi:hypothetical protein